MGNPFADRWNRKLTALGFDDTCTKFVRCGDAVLPIESAPFMRFDRAHRPAPLWTLWGIPDDWPPADRERVSAYRMIGSDGAGNPICLEQMGGSVVLLDHEDRFRSRQFVNSSVSQLAECLLAYLGEWDPGRFRVTVLAIDPPALAVGSFWWHEAAGIALDSEPLS